MIVIVDYNMGNLHSVQKAFSRIGTKTLISNKNKDINNATKLILPGVGYYKSGIMQLDKLKLTDILTQKVIEDGIPILGICLGMQLFTKRSDEGNSKGLGWIDLETVEFKFEKNDKKHKTPHMGWNTTSIINNSPLFDGISEKDYFYFAHSYYVKKNSRDFTIAETEYGVGFISSFSSKNIYGVQFHPEKSHNSGMKLLKNFVEKC